MSYLLSTARPGLSGVDRKVMEISLIHAGLAAGAALAALPVILHLFMRQTPKHVIFPALRLIRERQKRSKKRLRIKNWLLLLARMAILALMALALARPRLYSQMPLGDEAVPTALGLVFDTSLSMGYKEKDKTRLDEAKERAREILSKMPDSSLVFVVDSAEPGVPIGLSPAAALKRIEGLAIRAVNRPLNAAMGQVYAAVAECDRPVHVVYVLTDLARSAWDPDRPAEGSSRSPRSRRQGRRRSPRSSCGCARRRSERRGRFGRAVGERRDPGRIGGDPQPDPGRGPGRGEAPGRVRARRRKRGARSRSRFPPNEQVEVTFTTSSRLEEGELHRGKVKLGGAPDPFERDDERSSPSRFGRPSRSCSSRTCATTPNSSRRRSIPIRARMPPAAAWSSTSRGRRLRRAFPRRLARTSPASFCSTSGSSTSPTGERSTTTSTKVAGWWWRRGTRACPRATTIRSPASSCRRSSVTSRTRRSPATTFGKIANITHPLFQRVRQGPRQHARGGAGLPLLAGARPVDGDTRVLLSYADGAPALLGAHVQGAEDRPGLALDHAACRAARTVAAPAHRSRRLERVSPAAIRLVVPRPHEPDGPVPGRRDRTSSSTSRRARMSCSKLEPTVRFTNFLVDQPRSRDQAAGGSVSPSNEFLEIVAPPDLGPVDGQGDDGRQSGDNPGLQRQLAASRRASSSRCKSRTSTPSSARTATSWPRTPRRTRRRRSSRGSATRSFPG